MHFKHYVVMI